MGKICTRSQNNWMDTYLVLLVQSRTL